MFKKKISARKAGKPCQLRASLFGRETVVETRFGFAPASPRRVSTTVSLPHSDFFLLKAPSESTPVVTEEEKPSGSQYRCSDSQACHRAETRRGKTQDSRTSHHHDTRDKTLYQYL